MKRHIWALGLVLCCCVLLFSSCVIVGRDIEISLGGTYHYENNKKYTAGNVTLTESVLELDVSWISGNVDIEYHDGIGVVVTEDSSSDLDEDEKLRYWLDGTTLRIQYMKSGISLKVVPDKNLLIKLPKDILLSDIEIETVSADVIIGNMQMKDLDLETVSGDISLSDAVVSDGVSIHSVSGKVKGDLSTSDFSLEMVSGNSDITLHNIQEISVQSVSGNTRLVCADTPEEMDIETVSGECDISLPPNSEFTIDFDGVSGELESDFSVSLKGNKYICGNGMYKYNVETVSGDVKISPNKD